MTGTNNQFASLNDSEQNGNTSAAKNVPRVYSLPTPTQNYAESIIVESWRAWTDDDRQITTYRGLRHDLVAVGIAPAQIFDEVGKSGKKSARLLYSNGDKRVIKIDRMAHGEWRVDLWHSLGDMPYQSHKAMCTPQNGEMRDPDREQVEYEWLVKKLGFRNPCGYDNESASDTTDTTGPIRAATIINAKHRFTTAYSGSKERLLACGLLTADMLKRTGTKDWCVSFYRCDSGEDICHVCFYHDVIELSQDERSMAEALLAKNGAKFIDLLRRLLDDDDDD